VAQLTEWKPTPEQQSRLDAIIKALHSGESISNEDWAFVHELEQARDENRAEINQAIVDAALTDGRVIENSRVDMEEGAIQVAWTEIIPMPDGTSTIRRGLDILQEGRNGPEIVRQVTYWEPGNAFPKGSINSLISQGQERITQIMGFGKGHEYAGLTVGQTRPSPMPTSGAAGVKPSSWDPGTGQFGFASGGNNKPSTDTTTSRSSNSEPTGAGVGSPGMRGTDGVELSGVGQVLEADPGPGEQGGGDDGSEQAPGDNVDPDPGTEEQGGSDESDPMPEESSDPEAGSFGDEAGGGGDEAATPQGEVTAGEGQIEVGTFFTKGEGSDTYEYPSGATVEIPHDSSSDAEYHAADDYYSAGSAPIPQPGSGQSDEVATSGGGGGGGGYSMSWEQWQAQQAATWSDPNWNPDGAPIDYGNTADPNYDPVAPDPTTPQDDPNTQILVDPSWYEESQINPGIELEMAGVLENTGNPLDENQSEAPSGGMPNTSEQELVAGDALAVTGADMVGSVATGPEPGSVGAEEPEHGGPAPAMEDDGPLP
jgi:hypothetical protein